MCDLGGSFSDENTIRLGWMGIVRVLRGFSEIICSNSTVWLPNHRMIAYNMHFSMVSDQELHVDEIISSSIKKSLNPDKFHSFHTSLKGKVTQMNAESSVLGSDRNNWADYTTSCHSKCL